jgi:hypothetical protein
MMSGDFTSGHFPAGEPKPWWRRKAVVIAAAVCTIIAIATGAITLAFSARDAADRRAAESAAAEASRSSSVAPSQSASAATSRFRESERERVQSSEAVHNGCQSLATTSKDAIDKVNAFVSAVNANQRTGPTEGPAIQALNNSAATVDGSINSGLSQQLRDAFNAYVDAARAVANAIGTHAAIADFNNRVNQLNDTKSKALTLCQGR